MDINRPLPMHAITHIEQLAKGHPVWRVDFGPDSIVIKDESVAKASYVSDPMEVMQVVDRDAPTKIITKGPLLQLRAWVQRNGPAVVEKDPGFLLDDLNQALAVPIPGQAPVRPTVFFAMPMKQNLRDLHDAGLGKRGGNKAIVKELHAAFKQQGVLEKLGEILAADAFIGNQDRVNFEAVKGGNQKGRRWPDPEDLAPGESRIQLQCIQNPGNFFVADENGRATVLGLDVVDPGSLFKDLTSWNHNAWYPGQLLRTSAAADRANILGKVMADMNAIMGPRNRSMFKPTAKKTYMPSNSVQRMDRGMGSGASKLLNYFKRRYSNGGISPELQFRLHACGWLTRSNFPRL